MRTLRALLLIPVIFFTTQNHAQLLKKLAKRAGQASEEVILRKVEEKSIAKTENAMDTLLNLDKKLKKNKNRRARRAAEVPDNTRQHPFHFNAQEFLDQGRIEVYDLFVPNSQDLYPEAALLLKNISMILHEFPSTHLIIKVYSNTSDTYELSKLQAEIIKQLLVSEYEHDASTIMAIAKEGEQTSISLDTDGEAPASRIEFIKM